MLKQQTVPTSLGQLTVSSLTLGELRQLDALLAESVCCRAAGWLSCSSILPVIFSSCAKPTRTSTSDQLENGLTLEDFNVLFSAVLGSFRSQKGGCGGTHPGTGIADWPFSLATSLLLPDGLSGRSTGLRCGTSMSYSTYWQDYPPTHVLVAGYLLGGSRRGRRNSVQEGHGARFHELTHAVATAGGSISKRLPGIYKSG